MGDEKPLRDGNAGGDGRQCSSDWFGDEMFAAKMLDLESAETLNFISETLTEAHEKSNHLGTI